MYPILYRVSYESDRVNITKTVFGLTVFPHRFNWSVIGFHLVFTGNPESPCNVYTQILGVLFCDFTGNVVCIYM